jgi:hypothetical protein
MIKDNNIRTGKIKLSGIPGSVPSLCLLFLALLAAVSCENRDLSVDDPCDNLTGAVVKVVFHWEEDARPPENMTVWWYNSIRPKTIIEDYNSRKENMEYTLPEAFYTPLCADVYSFGNGTLGFRGTGSREGFEAYNLSGKASWYTNPNYGIPQLSTDEKVVGESEPYIFYADGDEDRTADTRGLGAGDTLTVDFYPKNALHEFTFLIHGVQGTKYIEYDRKDNKRGVVSGQSASFFPAGMTLANTPSSMVFSRIETHTNGQRNKWSEEQQHLFTRYDANWEKDSIEGGWTNDWITGKFSTFGPVNPENGRFRMTIGMVNKGGKLYWGLWGYGSATTHDELRRQLKGAWEDQKAWRERNGGFDIILAGAGGLIVLDDGSTEGGGGFIVDGDEWGEDINVNPR